MSDPIRKPDEFPSRSESILSDTIGLEGYSIETPPRSRIEKLLIELKEIIDQGGGSSTAYATSLEITMDEYFVMSATLKNKDGDTLGQVQTVDLPLESVVVNGSYDSINKNVVLTLENGNTVSFSVADLVSGLQTEITSNNKLDADLVDDTNSTHKFTTASDISKLAGIEEQANKTTIDDALSYSSTNPVQNKVVKTALDSKADASTTYTKTEVDTALAGKLGTDTHYAGSSTTGGSATSAAKLDNTTDAGSATQPVYFSSGVPTAITYSLAKSVPADAVFTDTTYESKAAASGGTDVSLVTTGDKYIWNNKQNTIDANSKLSADLVDDTNATHKFATTEQLSQITTNENNISYNTDNGVKNTFDFANAPQEANIYTIVSKTTTSLTVTANNPGAGSSSVVYSGKDYPAGNYIFSCKITDYICTTETARIYIATSTAAGTGVANKLITGNGTIQIPFNWNGGKVYIKYFPNESNTINQSNTFTASENMIMLASISDTTYQPYAMSNAELTALVLKVASVTYSLNDLTWTPSLDGMIYSNTTVVNGITSIYSAIITGFARLRATDVIVPILSNDGTQIRFMANTGSWVTDAEIKLRIVGI